MKRNALLTVLAVFVFLCAAAPAAAELTGLGKRFSDAMITDNTKKMNQIIVRNKSAVPGEVGEILKAAHDDGITSEDREALFHMGEKMALLYMENSGDTGLLKEVKKSRFEARLGEPVKSIRKGGAHIITIPSPDHPSKTGYSLKSFLAE